MNAQMTDPQIAMLSFQEGLTNGIVEVGPISGHPNLYSHFDVPAPGVKRLTYVRLTEDRRTVTAFVCCVPNGTVDGHPCISVGYAVPVENRNQGLAKHLLQVVLEDHAIQAQRNGLSAIYIESIIDRNNLPSQRVTESVFKVPREEIIDKESGVPAYRYTKRIDGRKL